MYSCLYNTCADINIFLCVCRGTLTHFTNIIPRIEDEGYDPTVSPLVS